MKQPLIMIGAGNVGGYLAYNISEFPDFELIGILDDDPSKHKKKINNFPVLGGVDLLFEMDIKNLAVVVCVNEPLIRKKIVNRIQMLSLDFPTFISPKAWISNGCEIGKGSIIYPGVSINYESYIGDFVIMNMNCALGHHSRLGSFVSFAPAVSLGGNTNLGEGVNMGISSSTLQGISVGDFSVIGGKAMVISHIPSFSKVVGVPGRIIGSIRI